MSRKKRMLACVIILFMILSLTGTVMADDFGHAERIAGTNRYDTAAMISEAGWESADTVILARGDDFPDALAGAPLAYSKNAPILLTNPRSLTERTKEEILRLGATSIYLLGGEGAISLNVEEELLGMNLQVHRIGGQNRYETAKLIAEELGDYDQAIIAFGLNFPDALAIGSYAAQEGIPILLTPRDRLITPTEEALEGVEKTYVIGGEAVVSDDVLNQLPNPTRIGGANRFETAVNIVKTFNLHTEEVFVATGMNFADALSGSALAARQNRAILLVQSHRVPAATDSLIKERGLRHFTVLGGEAAVEENTVKMMTGEPIIPDVEEIHLTLDASARIVDTGGGKTIDFTVTAVDENGSPIEGAEVSIYAGVDSSGSERTSQLSEAGGVTDERGRFKAIYTTSAQDDDERIVVDFNVHAGDVHSNISTRFIASNQAVLVEGTVYAPVGGQVMKGAKVEFNRTTGEHSFTHTDENGEYSVILLADRYDVRFMDLDLNEYSETISQTYRGSHHQVNPDGTGFLRLENQDFSNTGTVYTRDCKIGMVTGVMTRSLSDSQLYITPSGQRTGTVAVRVNQDGSFMVLLPPGSYDITDRAGSMGPNFKIEAYKVTELGSFRF